MTTDPLSPIPAPPLDLSRFENPAPESVPALRQELAVLASTIDDPFTMEEVYKAAKKLDVTKGTLDKAIRQVRRMAKAADAEPAFAVEVVADLYYDSQKNYYRRLGNGEWDSMGVDQTRRHLKVELGMSDEAPSGGISVVDAALHYIETKQRVFGALPFPLERDSVVDWNGKTYLNVATAALMQPAEGETKGWGDGFPRIQSMLETLFPGKALDAWNAWLRVWYKRVLATGRGGRGQAVFIVGPPKTGKTFLTNCVLGRIFGGVSDVSGYFVEGNQFNADMFNHAVWALDDSTILGDHDALKKFSALVKKAVANPSFPYDKKYGYKGSVPFNGRFTCTLNDGPSSIGILPDTDQDLLDKVILLRTGDKQMNLAPTEPERYEVLRVELPFYLRWIAQTGHAEWIGCSDGRCEIDSWHDSWVLDQAKSNAISETTSMVVMELMGDLQTDNKKVWEGSIGELYNRAKNSDSTKHMMQSIRNVQTFSKNLQKAIESGLTEVQFIGKHPKKRQVMVRVDLSSA